MHEGFPLNLPVPANRHCLQGGAVAAERAYLSNVCVAAAARRRGVAAALMSAAEAHAAQAGVRHLYVHVVADNAAAVALYGRMGYEVEAEEGEAQARALGRPRRKILHKRLGVD
jgi:ribosomal protein S18 acetylase RimI-like enzyme